MPKILFLDFDGPLHPTSAIDGIRRPPDELSFLERGLFRWAIHLDMILSRLDEEERSSILIAAHSSWRQIPGLSQQLIRDQLGPRLGPQYIGMTRPELGRWASIQDMCERGGFTDFLIIDDAVSEFPTDLPQLVVCSPLKGLSDPEVQRKIAEWAGACQHEKQQRRPERRLSSG